MSLYVSTDAKVWAKANFPSPTNLRQNVRMSLHLIITLTRMSVEQRTKKT